MRILQQAIFVSLALAAFVVSAQTPRTPQNESTAIQPEARQLLQLANRSRVQSGAAPLKWDAALAAAARQHCLRMAAEGLQLSHQYPGEPDVSERAKQAGARFSLIEENVAMAADPTAIHNAWLNSPHHRENLMNPDVDRVGIAVVAGRYGLYAVADYERAVPVLTQSEVEDSISGLLQASGVNLLPDAAPARAACATDSGMPHSSSGPQPRFVMRWQGADLTRLPQDLVDRLASGMYRRAAVGSCPTQGHEGAFTAYRIAVLLY
jgi:uncharacterized protein YkwD